MNDDLVGHLEELRGRLIVSLIFFILVIVVAYLNIDIILKHLLSLFNTNLIFIYPAEAFVVRLKIACYVGAGVAMPVWIYQIWKFVTPALYKNERKMLLILPWSYLLFVLGVFLGIRYVLPKGLSVLLSLGGQYMTPYISADAYVSFAFFVLLSFGVMFQIPLVVFMLLISGVVKTVQLGYARPYVIVGIFVVSAFLTPGPDVFSQLILGTLAYLLFELSIFICRFVIKKQ
ncbi:MAG: twin-arginine translocase subunit TatC [Elusimicrobiota bacterium]